MFLTQKKIVPSMFLTQKKIVPSNPKNILVNHKRHK